MTLNDMSPVSGIDSNAWAQRNCKTFACCIIKYSNVHWKFENQSISFWICTNLIHKLWSSPCMPENRNLFAVLMPKLRQIIFRYYMKMWTAVLYLISKAMKLWQWNSWTVYTFKFKIVKNKMFCCSTCIYKFAFYILLFFL